MDKLQEANNYQDKYRIKHKDRPLFHLSPEIGWLNDPNGFSEFNGKKHLFFQYHPYSLNWGPMHWGHAQSDDLIKWEYLPIILAPDQHYDNYGCFSGSAITTDDGHLLAYTGAFLEEDKEGILKEFQTQCLALGDGKTYDKYQQNPIIDGNSLPEGFSRTHFRDPKIWKEDDTYYLAAGNLDQDNLGQVLLFKSKDLKNWDYVSVLKHNDNGRYGLMWECPDFFPIDNKHMLIVSPQDMLAGENDFTNGNHTIYFIGDYNKETNQLEQDEAYLLDYGSEFYAAQTMQTEDGRRIMVAWLASWDVQTRERDQLWNGMLTLPRELSLRDNQLYQTPVKEIENYWKDQFKVEELEFQDNYFDDNLKGRTVDLKVDILEGDFNKFVIHFNHSSEFDTKFIIDKEQNKIIFDRTYSGIRRDVVCKREFSLKKTDYPLNLRLILDRYSAELFINDGQQTFSAALSTPENADQIYFECDGKCKINAELHSIEIEED